MYTKVVSTTSIISDYTTALFPDSDWSAADIFNSYAIIWYYLSYYIKFKRERKRCANEETLFVAVLTGKWTFCNIKT